MREIRREPDVAMGDLTLPVRISLFTGRPLRCAGARLLCGRDQSGQMRARRSGCSQAVTRPPVLRKPSQLKLAEAYTQQRDPPLNPKLRELR